MRTLPELLNSWLPASDRPSVLVAAGDTAAFLTAVERLQQAERAYEVVRVSAPADAQRLVRRGLISVLVVDAGNTLPGNLELLLEAVSKDKPPQILVVSAASQAQTVGRPVDIVSAAMGGDAWLKLAQDSARRFQSGKTEDLRAGDLLHALSVMPDEGWLRICSGDEFGDICVSQGKAVYCEVGRQSGDEAAAKICEWTNCLFEYRILPEFLRQNMDRPLGELRKSPSSATATAAVAQEADFEEPDQFPVLEELLRTAPARNTAVEPMGEPGMEEPDDLPSFDPKAADADIFVEEPQEFLLREDEDIPDDAMAEPVSMDLDAGVFAMPPVSAPPVFTPPPPRIFDSVAVLCMNRMVSCDPPADARYFDPETLSVFYERAKAYVMRHQIGESPLLQIGGGEGTIVVTAAKGGDCLVAVRTTSRQVTAEQQTELERLSEVHGAATPAFSR